MEAIIKRNNKVSTTSLFFCPQTSKLDSTLICLSTRITEEGLPRSAEKGWNGFVEHVRKKLSDFTTLFNVVIVAYMDKLFCLFGNSLRHSGMTMTKTVNANTRNKVQVFLSCVVSNFHARTLYQKHRFAREGLH